MKFKIIRLKNNPISEKYAAECVTQAKTFGIDVDYFDAINGLEYPSHLEKLKIVPRYKFKKGRAGVFGCFLSHYYLWKKCIEDNVPYLILEHDGYFIKLEKNQTGNYMRGAYGYIIKPHAAKKVIDWIVVNGFVPADQQIGDALVDIQVVAPSIVRLHPDYYNRIGELSLTGNPELL